MKLAYERIVILLALSLVGLGLKLAWDDGHHPGVIRILSVRESLSLYGGDGKTYPVGVDHCDMDCKVNQEMIPDPENAGQLHLGPESCDQLGDPCFNAGMQQAVRCYMCQDPTMSELCVTGTAKAANCQPMGVYHCANGTTFTGTCTLYRPVGGGVEFRCLAGGQQGIPPIGETCAQRGDMQQCDPDT